jgi:hypothetical protein
VALCLESAFKFIVHKSPFIELSAWLLIFRS